MSSIASVGGISSASGLRLNLGDFADLRSKAPQVGELLAISLSPGSLRKEDDPKSKGVEGDINLIHAMELIKKWAGSDTSLGPVYPSSVGASGARDPVNTGHSSSSGSGSVNMYV